MEGNSQLYGVEPFCRKSSVRVGNLKIQRSANWGATAQQSQNNEPAAIEPESSPPQNHSKDFSQAEALSNIAQWLCLTALRRCTSTSHSFYWSHGKRKSPAPSAARLSWARCFWTGEGLKLLTSRFERTSHSAMLKVEVNVLRQVIFFFI